MFHLLGFFSYICCMKNFTYNVTAIKDGIVSKRTGVLNLDTTPMCSSEKELDDLINKWNTSQVIPNSSNIIYIYSR
jgi:hypothetical protein